MGQVKLEDPQTTPNDCPESAIDARARMPGSTVSPDCETVNADADPHAAVVVLPLLDCEPMNVDVVQHVPSEIDSVKNTVDSNSDSLPIEPPQAAEPDSVAVVLPAVECEPLKVDTANATFDPEHTNVDSIPVEPLNPMDLDTADPSNEHEQVNADPILIATEPIPEFKTRRQHMNALILKNMADLASSTDTNMSSPSEESEKASTLSINSRTTLWRFVFNTHSELKGEALDDNEKVKYPQGKTLGGNDGVMWGATLADFYRTEPWSEPEPASIASTQSEADEPPPSPPPPRQRNKTSKSTVVSTSMLYARYSPIVTGEERYRRVRQILRIAETEEEPRIVLVYSIEKLIRHGESWAAEQEGGASWVRRSMSGLQKQREAWELPESWPPESVFSPTASPSPWPLEPFKNHWWQPTESVRNLVHVPTLQQYIPQHLLPEKLIVHDPCDLLKGQRCTEDKTTPFIQKDDIIRVYHLHLSEDARFNEDREELETESAKEKTIRETFLANPHSSMPMPEGMMYQPRQFSETSGLGPSKPPVFVVFPPRPSKVAPKVAHLYISPAETMGVGNHSFVYRAEFEIPRSMLVEDMICEECVRADVKHILEEEEGLASERRDPRWDETSGAYVLKLRGNAPRKVMFGSESALCEWDTGTQTAEVMYEGLYRVIQTTVGYQNLERAPYCEHLRRENVHPLTTKVQVAAKLSMKYDDHLPKEATNYQSFPKHFFEHRSGFILPELPGYNAPAPSGAVVPQFYGYYKEVWGDERNTDLKGRSQYLSPILLVEDCGNTIVPETMTVDDRNECVSLFLRMHAAEWLQNSLYRRNIVRQPGPLCDHPVIRRSNALSNRGEYGTHWSFRVIDFGRATHRDEMSDYEYRCDLDHERGKLVNWVQREMLN